MINNVLKIIQGWVKIKGATDGTMIGNSSDSLKTLNTNAAGASAVNVQDGGNSLTIDATSLPLPTGASTSALQATGNTSLGSIDTKLPSQVAGRVPVDGSGVTQPVSGTVAATQSGAWTFTASPGLGGKATYTANTGPITGATATGTKSLAYIWHPAAVTKTYRLTSVYIDQTAGNGANGAQTLQVNRITAENATPGGTTATILANETTDAASGATVRIAPTGAPTRATGSLFQINCDPKMNAQVQAVGSPIIEAIEIKPPTMVASAALGYEITQVVTTALSTAPVYNITFEWTEE